MPDEYTTIKTMLSETEFWVARKFFTVSIRFFIANFQQKIGIISLYNEW